MCSHMSTHVPRDAEIAFYYRARAACFVNAALVKARRGPRRDAKLEMPPRRSSTSFSRDSTCKNWITSPFKPTTSQRVLIFMCATTVRRFCIRTQAGRFCDWDKASLRWFRRLSIRRTSRCAFQPGNSNAPVNPSTAIATAQPASMSMTRKAMSSNLFAIP